MKMLDHIGNVAIVKPNLSVNINAHKAMRIVLAIHAATAACGASKSPRASWVASMNALAA